MITDTQVLSYYYRGALPLPADPVRVSSVTAAEFLQVQSRDQDPSKANYYPILPSRLNHRGGRAGDIGPGGTMFESQRHAAQGKHRTDQLVLDFGTSAPAYVEFGSFAISELIYGQHDRLYAASIEHLSKDLQKKLMRQFRFLVEHQVTCIALTRDVASIGMGLLSAFLDRYQAKENMRNTINDVLILATAIANEAPLITQDKLLVRFAAEVMSAPLATAGDFIRIDFATPTALDRRRPFESKGFVHRGWRIHERRSRGG